jgi:hypothetical protein
MALVATPIAPEAGYDDGRPRLGQGFQHDDKRLATDHSSDYNCDLRDETY